MVKKINAEEFNNEAMKGAAVVDFSAVWCGPCSMVAPVLEEISGEMTDVNFFNVDVDENPSLAVKYGISSIPAILILKDGEAKDMLVGFRPKEALVEGINNSLK